MLVHSKSLHSNVNVGIRVKCRYINHLGEGLISPSIKRTTIPRIHQGPGSPNKDNKNPHDGIEKVKL